MALFVGVVVVNRVSGSAFLVQSVGAAYWAPMLFGGVLAGAVADRMDRRSTMFRQLLAMVPLAIAMGILTEWGAADVLLVLVFTLAVGTGAVIDMTSRRALIYDFVGASQTTSAMALETLSMSGGNLIGAILGGVAMQFLGIGPAFMLIGALYGMAAVLLLRVPNPSRSIRTIPSSATFLRDLLDGAARLRRNAPIVSILGVTLAMNLFYFSFIPLIPVIADGFGADPVLSGALAGAPWLGMVIGVFFWTSSLVGRRGRALMGGCFLSLSFLLFFALADSLLLAFVALLGAGFGAAGFGSMQGVLTMDSAGAELRGRAMGVLSMVIGSVPLGMLSLGVLAQSVGPGTAVATSAVVGLVILLAWLRMWPQAINLD